MRAVSFDAANPSAVRGALVERGMDANRADASARGITPITLILDRLEGEERERVADGARRVGLEYLSGPDWVLLTGSAARIAGLTRAGASALSPALAELVGRLLAGAFDPPQCWEMARGTVQLDQPVVVGILNVTPDSFSDGGRYTTPKAAVARAEALLASGARMLDVGAESTRPGRPAQVPSEEEWARLGPVLVELVRRFPDAPVSVDTVKAETAERALDAGAWAINDVGGLRLDPTIANVCAQRGAGLILMHSRGTFSDMASYDQASYRNVIDDVARELEDAVAVAESHGVSRSRLVVDPGLGFAKRPEHNFAVLRDLSGLRILGLPIMVGPSRKRFLGEATGRDVRERDEATAAACAAAYERGATLFRVHEPRPTVDALAVAHRVRSG